MDRATSGHRTACETGPTAYPPSAACARRCPSRGSCRRSPPRCPCGTRGGAPGTRPGDAGEVELELLADVDRPVRLPACSGRAAAAGETCEPVAEVAERLVVVDHHPVVVDAAVTASPRASRAGRPRRRARTAGSASATCAEIGLGVLGLAGRITGSIASSSSAANGSSLSASALASRSAAASASFSAASGSPGDPPRSPSASGRSGSTAATVSGTTGSAGWAAGAGGASRNHGDRGRLARCDGGLGDLGSGVGATGHGGRRRGDLDRRRRPPGRPGARALGDAAAPGRGRCARAGPDRSGRPAPTRVVRFSRRDLGQRVAAPDGVVEVLVLLVVLSRHGHRGEPGRSVALHGSRRQPQRVAARNSLAGSEHGRAQGRVQVGDQVRRHAEVIGAGRQRPRRTAARPRRRSAACRA